MEAHLMYLYIQNNEVVANKNLMPIPDDYFNPITQQVLAKYVVDYHEWTKNNIKVENAEAWDDKNTITIYHLEEHRGDQDHTDLCNIGQPCYIKDGIVTELLTH